MAKRNAAKRMKASAEADNARFFEALSARGEEGYAVDEGWHPDEKSRVTKLPHNGAGARDKKFVKRVRPRSENQARLLEALDSHALVAALGPAGTGKTYLAISKAVDALMAGHVARIILARPAVEAGEQIGFLPGAMEDKLAPYLRPLFDALSDRLSPQQLKHMMSEGTIEIAPIGFMRGRTLNNAYIVIDEAQNCTYAQIKMMLTRLGWHSTMVLTGDPAQSDLLPEFSGLERAGEALDKLDGAAVIRLEGEDVVRHPLVAELLEVL